MGHPPHDNVVMWSFAASLSANERLIVGAVLLRAFTSSGYAHAQQCQVAATMQNNPSDTTPAGPDGLTHTTYAFVDSSGNLMTPDANTLAAVNGAIGEWNSLRTDSGVEFDPLETGQPASSANVQIQLVSDSSGKTGGCAAYNATSSRVYYGSTFQQAAANGNGVTIAAHELGHELGLIDAGTNPSPPSIMNNPSNSPPAACTNPTVPTRAVQASDAKQIPTCSKAAKGYQRYLEIKSGGTTSEGLTPTNSVGNGCTYSYYTINYYVDGVYDSSEIFLGGYSCQ